MDSIELLFLGTGTSTGIPMIGCHCEVCSSKDPHDTRTRPSALISYTGSKVLIDTTPELRVQCIANRIDLIDAVVFTHAHADHIMGLDDVRRFNAQRMGSLDAWADEKTHKSLMQCFGYAFKTPAPDQKVFRPWLIPRTIAGPFQIGSQTWTPIPLFHGEMAVLGFRVGNLAYCTDVSRIPEESFALLEGLDILVLDGLQWDKHTTHFSLQEAIDAAKRIGARQTLFTHIAHRLAHEATNKILPGNMRLAYDGGKGEDRVMPSKHYKAIAEYYDSENAGHRVLEEDVPFFMGQLPRRRQSILELAVGTGRAAIPLAQAGHRVVGVDYAADMLDIARRKRDAVGLREKQLELIEADVLKLDLGRRFDWVCVFFNTFLVFATLEQQDAALQIALRHLKPRGRFWVDVFQPDLRLLSEPLQLDLDPSLFYVPRYDRTVLKTIDSRRSDVPQVQHVTFHYKWFGSHGEEQHETTHFDMTYIFPRELRLLLERNGLKIEHLWGNYDGSILLPDSPRMIARCCRG